MTTLVTESDEYTCRKGVLHPGTMFTVTGGPYYLLRDGTRTALREKGPFRFRRYCRRGQRQWIEAVCREGFCVLNVGPQYESRVVPGLVHRPYRITRVIGAAAMKTDEVKVGKVYTAKVTDKVVPVRIDKAVRTGGWQATNLATGKTVRIKSVRRLRGTYRGKLPAKARTPAKSPTSADVAKRSTVPGKKAAAGKAATRAKQGKNKAKRMSGLDAAARVLTERGKPMGVKEIVEVAFEKGYWKSDGQTPSATIYAALVREISAKGKDSRFRKTERGKFAHA